MNPDINNPNPGQAGGPSPPNPAGPPLTPQPIQQAPYLDPTAGPPAPIMPSQTTPNHWAPTTGPSSVTMAPPPASNKKLKLIVISIVLAVLLIAGSAAAYVGVILPKKPENKLITAFGNASDQRQVTIKGSWNGQSNAANKSLGYNIEYTLALDANNNNFALQADIGIGGAKFPTEVRFIDQNLYFKVGGLASISSLSSYIPVDDPVAKQQLFDFIKKINDQWYEIDRSLWQTGTGGSDSCIDKLTTQLSSDDKQLIKSAFKKFKPLVVKNTSPAVVDSQPATKYALTLADGKSIKSFVAELNGLSLVKNINECDKSTKRLETAINESAVPTTPFNLYLNDKNQIKKFEISYTAEGGTGSFDAAFNWGTAVINKPDGAKPAQDLIGGFLGTGFEGL